MFFWGKWKSVSFSYRLVAAYYFPIDIDYTYLSWNNGNAFIFAKNTATTYK